MKKLLYALLLLAGFISNSTTAIDLYTEADEVTSDADDKSLVEDIADENITIEPTVTQQWK